MSLPRLVSFVLASLVVAVASTAQEAAVLKKSSPATTLGPIVSMRHVGSRTVPAMPVTAQPAAASARKAAATVRHLPVHFRSV